MTYLEGSRAWKRCLGFFRDQARSWSSQAGTYLNNRVIVFVPRLQMTTFPFESPDTTSPLWVNAKQVTYFGFSRPSKMPMRLYSVPFWSSVQKAMCPLPAVTIWFRSSGWNSTATIVSTEHYKSINITISRNNLDFSSKIFNVVRAVLRKIYNGIFWFFLILRFYFRAWRWH